MKRLFGMFKDRDTEGGAAAVEAAPAAPLAETREAWSPDGESAAESAKPDAAHAAASEGGEERVLKSLEGHPLKERIVAALKGVYDPEIPVNIYELGLIYDVKVSPENDIYVEMTLTTPGCPVAGQMPGMVQASIEGQVPEARDIQVEIVWDPPWTPDMMSEAAKLETGML
jgi:FeS assembly SUF system protein